MAPSHGISSRARIAGCTSVPVDMRKPRIAQAIRLQPPNPTARETHVAMAIEVTKLVCYTAGSCIAGAECAVACADLGRCQGDTNLATDFAIAGATAMICFFMLAVVQVMTLKHLAALQLLDRLNKWRLECSIDLDESDGYQYKFSHEDKETYLSSDILSWIKLENSKDKEIISQVNFSGRQPTNHSLMPTSLMDFFSDLREFYMLPAEDANDLLVRHRFIESRARVALLFLVPISCCYSLRAASHFWRPEGRYQGCSDSLKNFVKTTSVLRAVAIGVFTIVGIFYWRLCKPVPKEFKDDEVREQLHKTDKTD